MNKIFYTKILYIYYIILIHNTNQCSLNIFEQLNLKKLINYDCDSLKLA